VRRTEPDARPDWRPGADLETLKLRAKLLARVRAFFADRDVLEVDTPILSRVGTTDPAIESFASGYQGPGSAAVLPLYLQSSPEFCMKRLLAAGSGAIYQLSHVFRNGESGGRHNPEFMLLEWYRPGFSPYALMDEVDALLKHVLLGFGEYQPARRITYQHWFLEETGLDPWSDRLDAFHAFAQEHLASVPDGLPADKIDPWLHLLLTHWLEPRLPQGAVFVHDFPVSQASLARVRAQPLPVAERFELYVHGVELANGFHELADAEEQLRRFSRDNHIRQVCGQRVMPVDALLLAALEHGLPDTSGVALGFDRLVMLAAGLVDIDRAMPFSLQRS
jgi:lysyl-tRNA synthetase class 2